MLGYGELWGVVSCCVAVVPSENMAVSSFRTWRKRAFCAHWQCSVQCAALQKCKSGTHSTLQVVAGCTSFSVERACCWFIRRVPYHEQ